MSAFCNCQKGDGILKMTKRNFSGLLAAMMLFTTAFAVNDSATTKAANALTFAFKPITGSAYGVSPFFRVSFATNEATLTAAMDAIADAVAQLTTEEIR